MGKFREENGITRLQKVIQKITDAGEYLPPEVRKLLEFVPGIGKVVQIYNAVTEDTKISPLAKEELMEALEVAIDEMQLVTERHRIDNSGVYRITSLVRPIMSLSWLLMVITWMVFDRFQIGHPDPDKTAIILEVFRDMVYFYFGGRTVEKIVKEFTANSNQSSSKFSDLFKRKRHGQ